MGMMIAFASLGAVSLGLLVALLVQASGTRRILDELARSNSSAAKSAARSLPAAAVEQRLAGLEVKLDEVASAVSRISRAVRPIDRAAARPPLRPTIEPTRDHAAPAARPVDPWMGAAGADDQLRTERDPAAQPLRAPSSASIPEDPRSEGAEQTSPDELVDAYRELIARPRKSEIARWFEEVGGLSCEAGDDDVFQMVGRGDGGRLMLVPLTETLALVLPSALMVADFPTSFSDVLGARTALRRTFALDADGSGALRLSEQAMAVWSEGAWRLKVPGRIGGLVSG